MFVGMPSGELSSSPKRRLPRKSRSRITNSVQRSPRRSRALAIGQVERGSEGEEEAGGAMGKEYHPEACKLKVTGLESSHLQNASYFPTKRRSHAEPHPGPRQ